MAYINYRKNNPLYSPGLSVYGKQESVDEQSLSPEKGPKGNDGSSIYFINSTISDGMDEVNTLIRANISFDQSNTEKVEYRTGDIIIDDTGIVYRIKDGEVSSETKIGDFTKSLRKCFYETNENKLRLFNKIDENDVDINIDVFFDLITENGTIIYNVDVNSVLTYNSDGKWEYKYDDENINIQFIQERDSNGNNLIFNIEKTNN